MTNTRVATLRPAMNPKCVLGLRDMGRVAIVPVNSRLTGTRDRANVNAVGHVRKETPGNGLRSRAPSEGPSEVPGIAVNSRCQCWSKSVSIVMSGVPANRVLTPFRLSSLVPVSGYVFRESAPECAQVCPNAWTIDVPSTNTRSSGSHAPGTGADQAVHRRGSANRRSRRPETHCRPVPVFYSSIRCEASTAPCLRLRGDPCPASAGLQHLKQNRSQGMRSKSEPGTPEFPPGAC